MYVRRKEKKEKMKKDKKREMEKRGKKREKIFISRCHNPLIGCVPLIT